MTTAEEFIKYLQKLPKDTIIKVIEGRDREYAHWNEEVDLNMDPFSESGNMEFTDYTGNKFVDKTHNMYNKKILVLGNE